VPQGATAVRWVTNTIHAVQPINSIAIFARRRAGRADGPFAAALAPPVA